MKVSLVKKRFVVTCSFDEKQLVSKSGFVWDTNLKRWVSSNLGAVYKLIQLGIEQGVRVVLAPEVQHCFNAELIVFDKYDAWHMPKSVQRFFPHQRVGLRFVLERSKAYLAADPGLGKTAMALTAAATLQTHAGGAATTLYITPPFLVRNVWCEIDEWVPRLTKFIVSSKNFDKVPNGTDVLIVPDSLIASEWFEDFVKEHFGHEHVLKVLIIDEAHRFKTSTAKRLRAVLGFRRSRGILPYFDRQILLSGTPMPNRPIELYEVLRRVAPETIDWMTKEQYGERYCGAHRKFGRVDMQGASNVKELARRVIHPRGPFMLRMRADVLELPPLRQSVFHLANDAPKRLQAFDAELIKTFGSAKDTIKAMLANKVGVDESSLHISTYRKLLGEHKAVDSLDYINSILDRDDDTAIIVFAYHTEAIAALTSGTSKHTPLVIDGKTPMASRNKIVNAFQNDKRHRLLVGNYEAMGVGFNITRASRILMVEYAWVPAVNLQAIKRAHRIGQKRSVYVEYVTYHNSLDAKVIKALLRKQRSIDQFEGEGP